MILYNRGTTIVEVGDDDGICSAHAKQFLGMKLAADTDLLKKVITDDESWVYGYAQIFPMESVLLRLRR